MRKQQRNDYRVIVGNIGTVYSGRSKKMANEKYETYVASSKSGHGRASGESVTIFCNDEPCREFIGINDDID